MGCIHTEYWVARPTHSTGFGFASVTAVRDAFEAAFARAVGSIPDLVEVHLASSVPVDRRYELSIIEQSDGSLDGLAVASATTSPYSSS
jgi:hypothetical protein